MFWRLLALLTVVPLVELALLVWIGNRLGLGATIGLVLVTGVLGAWLARQQGLAVVGRIQSQLAAGQVPGAALVDGLLVLLAGAVLLTPGLLTDAFGFLLLAPPARARLRRFLRRRYADRFQAVRTDGAGRRVVIIEPDEASDGTRPESGSEASPDGRLEGEPEAKSEDRR